MDDELLFEERIISNRTEALFIFLTVLFGQLYFVRRKTGIKGKISTLSSFFSLLFLLYALNYRTLIIRLSSSSLCLKFGLPNWWVPLENIESIQVDDISPLLRMGGAGVHFLFVHNRYRASFNFLEYPRLVIGFKEKVGPVQDLSFSTGQTS